MMAAGVSAEEIKTRGRWASDVYEIYCRVCERRLLEISELMSRVDTNPLIGQGDGFFEAFAGREQEEGEEMDETGDGEPQCDMASDDDEDDSDDSDFEDV